MATIKKNSSKLPVYIWIFIIVEALIYVTFMYIDIVINGGDASNNGLVTALQKSQIFSNAYLKYYAIIICLAVTVIIYYKNKSKVNALIAGAMFFTAFADYFLLLNPDRMVPGLVSFCIVHGIYLYVILGGDSKKTAIICFIRIGISVIVTVILIASGLIRFSNESSLSSVLFLVIVYGLSFVWNVVLMFSNLVGPDPSTAKSAKITDTAYCTCLFAHKKMFLTGLVLFLLCDLNVMIYNLGSFINLSSNFYHMLQTSSVVLMWAFYLPSQVLIVLSALLPSDQN